MQTVFNIALPSFALIFGGYAAGRFQLLSEPAIAGLNSFVFYFALPALLFFKMAAMPIVALFDWRFVAAYSGGGLIAFAACASLGRVFFRTRLAECGLQGIAAAFPNVGYLGLPLLIAVFGDRATLPCVLVLVFDHLLLLPLTTALIEADIGKGHSAKRIVAIVAAGIARNPLIIATVSGALVGLTGIAMPVPAAAFGSLLGSAAAPCALFALGATLVGRPISANKHEVALLVGSKLFVHPAAAAFIGYELLGLDPFLANIAIIEGSLPIAANVFIMARAYGFYVARTSTAILVSTIVSVFTVSALLAWLVR
jgi:predicted permease